MATNNQIVKSLLDVPPTSEAELVDLVRELIQGLTAAFGSPSRVRIVGTRLEPCPNTATGLWAVGVSYHIVPAEKSS